MDRIEKLKNEALQQGKGICAGEALELFIEGSDHPWRVFAAASEIREHFKGKSIILCGITNAKSGRCSEDCTFCAQSSHYPTRAPIYPLKPAEEMLEEAVRAQKDGAEFFSLVTSGKRLKTKKEWAEVLRTVEGVKNMGLSPCASLGLLDPARARELKDAGLVRYHHNLETARSFFKTICTTHDYEEDVETIRSAREAGLSVCAGGLFGLGEGMTHRIELAETLRDLAVDSVPVNLLHPIKGTPLYGMKPLSPMEILMTLAVYRFLLPDKDIKLCGGKEKNLRQLLPLSLMAGVNSLMTGNYLTTTGRESLMDHEMIEDMGLVPTRMIDLCRCAEEDHLKTPAKDISRKKTGK